MIDVYVVTGAGPVGWTVAEQLAEQGKKRPDPHPFGQRPRASPGGAREGGRRRMPPNCGMPSQVPPPSFTASTALPTLRHAWQAELPRAEQKVLAAAGEAGAVVVFPESLYSYSEPDAP